MPTLDDVQAKIFEIQYLRSKMTKDIASKREELYKLANVFDNYYDLYVYGKRISSSLEEFNEIMLKVRDIFFNR